MDRSPTLQCARDIVINIQEENESNCSQETRLFALTPAGNTLVCGAQTIPNQRPWAGNMQEKKLQLVVVHVHRDWIFPGGFLSGR